MSLEAVQKVTETERRAKERRLETLEQAKRLTAEAERAGQVRLSQAQAEADAQVKAMFAQAEQEAAADTEVTMEEAKRSCDALRLEAEGRLEAAAELIIKRVVGD